MCSFVKWDADLGVSRGEAALSWGAVWRKWMSRSGDDPIVEYSLRSRSAFCGSVSVGGRGRGAGCAA